MNRLSEKWLIQLCLAGTMLGWGWAWVGIRSAVRYYEPGPLALGRYLVASLVLLPIWLWRGAKLPAARDWPIFLVMGVLGFMLYNLGINLGEKTITAGTASLIGAGIPVMITLGGRYFFAEKLTVAGWLGVVLSLSGVAIITVGAEGGLHFSPGALLVFGASFCATIYGLLNKRMVSRYAPLEITTWSIWIGTLGLIPTGSGLLETIRLAPWSATGNVILLGILPGAACYALWSFAFSKIPMARVASWMFLIPFTSVVLGWVQLGELPTPMAAVGGLVTLTGVYLVNTWGRILVQHPAAKA